MTMGREKQRIVDATSAHLYLCEARDKHSLQQAKQRKVVAGNYANAILALLQESIDEDPTHTVFAIHSTEGDSAIRSLWEHHDRLQRDAVMEKLQELGFRAVLLDDDRIIKFTLDANCREDTP